MKNQKMNITDIAELLIENFIRKLLNSWTVISCFAWSKTKNWCSMQNLSRKKEKSKRRSFWMTIWTLKKYFVIVVHPAFVLIS